MFKLTALILASFIAVAAADPSHLAASPVVYPSQFVQPFVGTHYVKAVATPFVHTVSSPIFHGFTSPIANTLVHPGYYSYGALPLASNYASSAYGPLKKTT